MNLEVRHVGFQYGARPILKNVSFSEEYGHLLCVLGPNGVGKSTLFRCVLGLIKNFQGEILINGADNKKLDAIQLAREIAYVPQSHHSAFSYTVLDIALMGTAARMGKRFFPGAKETERAMEALKSLGILHLRDRVYSHISGGEAQLVLLARAIAQQAKILILDEPTASLDYGNQIRVMEKIKELSEQGYLIVQSTHNPQLAFLYADSVLVLMKGSVEATGPPERVLSEEMLWKLYGVPVRLFQFQNLRVCIPAKKDEYKNVGII